MADSNLQSHQAISPMNRWVDLREFLPEDILSIKNQGIPRLLSLYPTLGLRSGTIESQSLTMISLKRYVPQGLGYGQQHWRRFRFNHPQPRGVPYFSPLQKLNLFHGSPDLHPF
jgi:hypothetical protein